MSRGWDEGMDEEPHRIDGVTSLGETERAVKCRIHGETVWIPKSQITDDSEVYKAHQTGTLVVTGWLAKQEGWA